MAEIFCAGLLVYYLIFLRKKLGGTSSLARLLWGTYFALGCSGVIISLTGVLEPVFEPNYPAILYLLLCILIGISGFLGFRADDVRDVIQRIRGQNLIEFILLALQGFSIAFFIPFAISSFTGDASVNRLELSNKMEVMSEYGLINTIAGVGAHLFAASLAMAFVRLLQPKGEGYNIFRSLLLLLGSLSYVIYILAYVGRDGSIYWLMTAMLMFFIFRSQMSAKLQWRIINTGAFMCALVIIPTATITISRFADSSFGVGGSLFEYFGAQIHHFSDYASIYRPRTYGAMNFPLVWQNICPLMSDVRCESWDDVKLYIFEQYLAQGKAPWLFGTYISDFVADFGFIGVVIFVTIFAILCHFACVGRNAQGELSISRLFLIIFYFLTPYWGVFYFRFGISNSFILVNLAFIALVGVIQHLYAAREVGIAVSSRPLKL